MTEGDLAIPTLTFVFGQAQLDGPVAVVSLARLRQEFYGLPGDDSVTRTGGEGSAARIGAHVWTDTLRGFEVRDEPGYAYRARG